jgi:excisionase family DNA binding protein
MDTTPPEIKAEWVSYKEAQKITGLSRATLWRFAKEGRLVVSRQGRAVRLQRQSIDDLMWHGVRSAEAGTPPSEDTRDESQVTSPPAG